MKRVKKGDVYGRWTVLELKYKRRKAKCICKCGKTKWVYKTNLTSGKSLSCGCFTVEVNRERMSTMAADHPKLYRCYLAMKNRCYNKNVKSYKNYGDLGIEVCDEWKENFEPFCIWALENGYKPGLTLDRIDTYGDYEPSNCRYVDMFEQAKNKRNNRLITIKGETKILAEWARDIGINHNTLMRRIEKGWTDDELLMKPSWKKKEDREEYKRSVNS